MGCGSERDAVASVSASVWLSVPTLVDLAPLRGLPHLRSLSIRLHDNASVLEARLRPRHAYISLRPLPTTLQEIDLTCLGLTSCSDLASIPQLRTLNLDRCVHLRTLEGLQHCPQLDCLQLHYCCGLDGVAPLSGTPAASITATLPRG